MKPNISSTAMDFIGDIHGHADELEELLEGELHYTKTNGYYQNATRKAFFVGDFIDRGPQIKKVLEIVRPMIDNGAAFTVIGNHEYNAICYWTKGANGDYLRAHSKKNEDQHKKTIEAFDNLELFHEYVEWFKTLPIYFDHGHFKVVHAQWKQEYINQLKSNGIQNLSDLDFLFKSAARGSHEYKMVDCLLKGEEVDVPEVKFKDKDDNERFAYRLRWWLKGDSLTRKHSLFEFDENAADGILPGSYLGYEPQEVPVFFGHYWLKGIPSLQQSNVCCLDYSVAKEGVLAAYRWDGEMELDQSKFICV